MRWLNRVRDDLSTLPDCVDYYYKELEQAKFETKISGRLEKAIAEIPGITENRFGQLQDVESILEHLNIQLTKMRSKFFRQYLEKYNRALSSREAEKFADGEQDVIDMQTLINEVALVRNSYLGILKGLEAKQWQLGHIVKLRTAGMEDVII